jgi:diguanylate cyclase (GGDEF)-like protein
MVATKTLKVTISVGVALSNDFPARDADDILHAADMALYDAKESGRNCVRVAKPGMLVREDETARAQSPVLVSHK